MKHALVCEILLLSGLLSMYWSPDCHVCILVYHLYRMVGIKKAQGCDKHGILLFSS